MKEKILEVRGVSDSTTTKSEKSGFTASEKFKNASYMETLGLGESDDFKKFIEKHIKVECIERFENLATVWFGEREIKGFSFDAICEVTKTYKLVFSEVDETSEKFDKNEFIDCIKVKNSKGVIKSFWAKEQKVCSELDCLRSFNSAVRLLTAKRIERESAEKLEKIEREKAEKVTKAANLGLTPEQIEGLKALGII